VSSEIVAIQGMTTVVRSTAKAGCFRLSTGREVWLPWSIVDEGSVDKDGATGTLYVKQWLADKESLPYGD